MLETVYLVLFSIVKILGLMILTSCALLVLFVLVKVIVDLLVGRK